MVSPELVLEPHTLVTIGGPGGWWVIDELVVIDGPWEVAGEEAYEVQPLAEWGAALARSSVDDDPELWPPSQMLLSKDLWVYRDGDEQLVYVDEYPPADPLDWMRRMRRLPSDEPPRTRVPRRAVELTSIIGRTVRLERPEGWEWAKAVSEPMSRDGQWFIVVCTMSDYWRAVYHRPNGSPTWLRWVDYTSVWTY